MAKNVKYSITYRKIKFYNNYIQIDLTIYNPILLKFLNKNQVDTLRIFVKFINFGYPTLVFFNKCRKIRDQVQDKIYFVCKNVLQNLVLQNEIEQFTFLALNKSSTTRINRRSLAWNSQKKWSIFRGGADPLFSQPLLN